MREAAEEAGRDPADVEITLSGYLPALTEEDVERAEAAGAARMVVATTVTGDLDQVQEEMSGFAERFGLEDRGGRVPAGGVSGGRR